MEINRLYAIFHNKFSDKNYNIQKLVLAYQGFSIEQIRKSISKIIFLNISNDKLINHILLEKKQIIQQTDILEFYSYNKKLDNIGGLKNLKSWLNKRSQTFSSKAKNYGIPIPKGILLVGIQGTGKSLIAKSLASEWSLPLLKLDIGKIFAGIVGESENRMRKMIQTSERLSPCILWIDEIDKTFSKYQNYNDSGTNNRVMNSLLIWLAEKNKYVFIVATANNIIHIPPEMLRKGRFDEIFFLDLPTFEERLNIFKIHLERFRPLSWYKYNLYYLSKITYLFSGAEIEQSIIEAMYNAFNDNREFNTRDIAIAIKELIPLAFIYKEQINSLKKLIETGKIRHAS